MTVEFDFFESTLSTYFDGPVDFRSFYDQASFHILNIGSPFLVDSFEEGYHYFLLSGTVRELVSSPSNKQFTLALHNSPFYFSVSNSLDLNNSRLLLASSDLIFTAIPSTLISTLPDTSTSFIDSYIEPFDLWRILCLYHPNPQTISPAFAKSFISNNLSRLKRFTVASDVALLNLSQDYHSIFYSKTLNDSIQQGHLVDLSNTSSISFPAILLGSLVPFKEFRSPGLNPLIDTNSALSDSQPSDESFTFDSVDINLPSSDVTVSPSNDDRTESIRRKKIRHFESSADELQILVSCFQSLSCYYNLPFNRDNLVLKFKSMVSDGVDITSLSVCAAVAESLGLQTQTLKLPCDLISRLDLPAFLRFKSGEIAVALDSNPSSITISRPYHGFEKYSYSSLFDYADSNSQIDVLLFRVTDFTPNKKFGLSWFLPSLRRHRKSLIEVFIASFFVQLFQLMNPLIVQQIIDKVIGQGGSGTLPVLAFLIIIFALFENLLTALRTNLFIDTTNRIDISLGEQVIDHLLRLPLSYFDKRPVGELSSRLAELEQVRSFLTGTALTVVLDVIFSFIYIAVMVIYSWVLAIVALLVAPLLAFITFTISPVVRGQLREKAKLNAKTQNHLVEILTGIQTVKAQNFETKARWRWKDRYSLYVTQGFKNAVTSTTSSSFTQFLNQLSSLLVLCVGAYLVIDGNLTLGQLIAFRIISGYVTTPLLRLSNLYQNFQQTSISLERLADIIDSPVESSADDKSNITMPEISGKITFKDVSFAFQPNTPLQLSNINLNVASGQFVAIVGQSGSGKSTLTKLLPRLYAPSAGRISIDDYDISKVELYSLRTQIGIVPQDSLLFEGSVQENIALTNPEASSDDVVKAAKLACAHDFIMSLPSGYGTSVGERGGALSGGQRQRIAIARSILQNPRMLIMDEATSALDYETERAVSLNLMEHFRGKTTLFITHRLSSVIHADLIVLMHDGCIDEFGTHTELMNRKGRYYALFNQQGASLL